MWKGYRFAIAWIAENDNAGNGDSIEEIAGYISVLLIADSVGKSPEVVARDVQRYRTQHSIQQEIEK